jgi:hypothetical protein
MSTLEKFDRFPFGRTIKNPALADEYADVLLVVLGEIHKRFGSVNFVKIQPSHVPIMARGGQRDAAPSI